MPIRAPCGIGLDASLLQIVPDPVRVQRLPSPGVHFNLLALLAVPRPPELNPRPLLLVLAPAVIQAAHAPDGPRPEERLARALDDKVREQEHVVHVALAALCFAKGVCRGLGEPFGPDERVFLDERK